MATLAELRTMLAEAEAAKRAVYSSQEYRRGDFTLVRPKLDELNKEITRLERQISALESGRRGSGPRVFRVIPRDL